MTEKEYAPNKEQQEAIDHLDGPLLVLAGPGTGKTELLSRRTANIFESRDVLPQNILCLTFTEIGAATMRDRLVQVMGQDAYGVEVSTFHGFASSLKQRWPEYFARPATDMLVTDLHSKEIIEDLLNALPEDDILRQRPRDSYEQGETWSISSNLGPVSQFISKAEQSGLSIQELEQINGQTYSFLQAIQERIDEGEATVPKLSGKKADKEKAINKFVGWFNRAIGGEDSPFRKSLIDTPGMYVPYAILMSEAFDITSGNDDGAPNVVSFKGDYGPSFREWREAFFFQGVLKDIIVCERAQSATRIYAAYRERLRAEHLYGFQDMINDAIEAIENNPEFAALLQDRYEYIQIDEFQDTNGSQMRLVDLLCKGSDNPNIMVVGDDDQSIMRFQGASVRFIQQFGEHYKAHQVTLRTNYRSRPALVDLGQYVVHQIEQRADDSKTLKPFKEERPLKFDVFSYPDEGIEMYALSKDIRARIDAMADRGEELGSDDIAVISRNNRELSRLIFYLNHFEIPFSYKISSTLETVESLQTLLALLRAVSALATGHVSYIDTYLSAVVGSPELGLDPATCVRTAIAANAFRNTHRNEPDEVSPWLETLAASDDADFRALAATIIDAAGRAAGTPVRELISELARPLSKYYSLNREEEPLSYLEFDYGLKALLDFAQSEIEVAFQTGAATSDSDDGTVRRPLRLPQVIDRLEKAAHLKTEVTVGIPVMHEAAVTLTTAHSSKGAEYGFVYLLNADDDSWHKTKSRGTRVMPRNYLFSNDGDEDDNRRLIFVAVTRAKEGLAAFKTDGVLLRELHDAAGLREIDGMGLLVPEDAQCTLVETGRVGWLQKLALSIDDFMNLFAPKLDQGRLSASKLNKFAMYEAGCGNTLVFPETGLLGLPEAPSEALDFGNHVHAFLKAYVDAVTHGKEADVHALADGFAKRLDAFDYSDAKIADWHSRFDRVVELFLPKLDSILDEHAGARILTEQWIKTEVEGLPLIGAVDLMVCDDAEKTITVYDYKTGKNKADVKEDKRDEGYMRQLRFYRLLIESSPEYTGWRVGKVANLYVEPKQDEKTKEYAATDPVSYSVTDEDVTHVFELAKAVWWRIREGLFDTSAFETSAQYDAALAASVKKDGMPKKNPDKRLLQAAFEDWLIDTASER